MSENQEVVARYTVRDSMNYTIGKYVFKDGVLELHSEEDAKAFADVLSKCAIMVRNSIRKTDHAKGAAIVAAHQAKGSKAHQGGADSLTNRAQPNVPDLNEANAALESSMDDIPDGEPEEDSGSGSGSATPSFSLKH